MPTALHVGLVVGAGLVGLLVGVFMARAVAHGRARTALVIAGTGISFAAITWWFPAASTLPGPALVPVVLAYLFFAAISIVLTVIDLDTHRLPNAIVLPGYLVVGGALIAACLLGAPWSALLRAATGMLLLFAFYFLLRVIRPGAMGGGDVKLAGLLGLLLGWAGWSSLVVGAFAGFLLGGVFGAILLVARRADRRTAIPFGPWMILGAWVGVFAGEVLGSLFLGR